MMRSLFLRLRLLSALCAVAAVTGCINTPPADNLTPVPTNFIPPAVPATTFDPYRLQIGDVMDIKLILNPELNDEVTVSPDGTISTSLAQNVTAYGRTPAELQGELEERYGKQLRNPHIAVLLRSFAPSRVYVTGEVNTPGEFITVGPNLSLLQAIARAGGLKNSARPDELILLRRGSGEHPQVYSANFTAAASGQDPASDVRLVNYDVVYVPRSDVGDVYLYFQQYFEQFVPISFGLSSAVGGIP